MLGLVPGIHVLRACVKDVDGRDKPGHDEARGDLMSDRLLVLVRHGQSHWNLKNLFTGWKDVDLTEAGVAEARAAGRKLKSQGLRFDLAYTSALKRAQRTLDLMLEEMAQSGVPIVRDQALNELDSGHLVGM